MEALMARVKKLRRKTTVRASLFGLLSVRITRRHEQPASESGPKRLVDRNLDQDIGQSD